MAKLFLVRRTLLLHLLFQLLLLGLLFFVGSLAVPSAFADDKADECASCVERKQRICADECEEVSQDRARFCQQKCIAGYCTHKCRPDAPELSAYIKETCDDCLEQQYPLCDPHCPVGTERRRALCKLKCSNDRCLELCKAPKGKKVVPEQESDPEDSQ